MDLKHRVGDRIQILEQAYCGISFARVGDLATISHLGPIASGFWVVFDAEPSTPCMILAEHAGTGWGFVDESQLTKAA